MNLDGSMVHTTHTGISSTVFGIDSMDNMLYYYDIDDDTIKRTPLDQNIPETIYTSASNHDADGIAVDWIGRYSHLFNAANMLSSSHRSSQ